MKNLVAIVFCCTIVLLHSGDCSIDPISCAGLPAHRLSNDFLAVTVIPFATGAITGLTWHANGQILMPDFSYQKEEDDLVPDRHSIGASGSRILLWGEKNLTCQEMQVNRLHVNPDTAQIEMFNRYYQGHALSCWRTIAIDQHRAAVRVTMRLRNTGKNERKVTLWDNLVAQLNPEIMDDVLMPGRPGLKNVSGVGVINLPTEQIFIDGPEVFAKVNVIAPSRAWIARRNRSSRLVMAIRTDATNLLPHGFLYSWKQNAYSPVLTMEMIFNPVTLPPAGELSLTFEYLIFDGLAGLHAICGDLGIWAEYQDNIHLTLHLAAVSTLPARKLRLELIRDAETPILVSELEIPAIAPGKAIPLPLQLPADDQKKPHLRGTFEDGSTFTLLPEA